MDARHLKTFAACRPSSAFTWPHLAAGAYLCARPPRSSIWFIDQAALLGLVGHSDTLKEPKVEQLEQVQRGRHVNMGRKSSEAGNHQSPSVESESVAAGGKGGGGSGSGGDAHLAAGKDEPRGAHSAAIRLA